MMMMVVSAGLRPAVLVVPVVVIVSSVGGPRDRVRRRDDDQRRSWGWWRWNRLGGRSAVGCGRWRRWRARGGCARGRWRRLGPGSADGPRRSGRCTAVRHRAEHQQASCGRPGGDRHGRPMDCRPRGDGCLHGARGAGRSRRRRAGGGPDRRLGTLLRGVRDAQREDSDERHRHGDRPYPGVASPPGPPARGRARRGGILRFGRRVDGRGPGRST